MAQNGQQPTKKPYVTPTLTTYGDVLRITKAVGMSGDFDGGLPGNNKTLP